MRIIIFGTFHNSPVIMARSNFGIPSQVGICDRRCNMLMFVVKFLSVEVVRGSIEAEMAAIILVGGGIAELLGPEMRGW